LNIELSGLPIYDRERRFLGYRGFGVCRDLQHGADIARTRQPAEGKVEPAPKGRDAPLSHSELVAGGPSHVPATAMQSVEEARLPLALVASAQNVVPFRAAAPATEKAIGLTSIEHKAFNEIGRQLSARLDAAEPVLRSESRTRARRSNRKSIQLSYPRAPKPSSRNRAATTAIFEHCSISCPTAS
jgi:hypothetical protein